MTTRVTTPVDGLASNFGTERLTSIHASMQGAAASSGLHHVGRNLAEHVSEHVEHLDFFSENSIGACVTCFLSVVIWLVFLPIFHIGVVPLMHDWEQQHSLTVADYMQRAEETFPTPHEAFEVLDGDADRNSTEQEFRDGSAVFKRPPFRYPAEMYPIFREIDANGDGVISDTEFYAASPSGLPTKWHVNMSDLKSRAKEGYGYLDSYYTAMDIKSDGKVDLQEFIEMAAALSPPVPEPDAKALFLKADTDGLGYIEPREWVSYNVSRTFTFQTTLDSGILPEGPRVMLAVEAGLRGTLEILQFDLLSVNEVKEMKKRQLTEGSERSLSSQSVVNLRVSFTVFVGTRTRQSEMMNDVKALPNDEYRAYFDASINGGSTTIMPAGPAITAPPAQKAGPLSDDDLKAYLDVPAIVQGYTELLLSHCQADLTTMEQQSDDLKPIFKTSFDSFCKCSITVDSVSAEALQDTTGQGLGTNKTMIVSWSIDLKHGGKFEKLLQDSGHTLVHGIYSSVMEANLPFMSGVKLDSWTRFTATYYGQAAADLPRGTAIKQYLGHFRNPSKEISGRHNDEVDAIRNDTGTPPFVTHPAPPSDAH